MPEYTKEQIAEAVRECDRFAEKHYDKEIAPYVAILSYALSTAEQERDAALAQCAELKARLQGAATSESAMETAREAVDTMGRKMLALGKEIDTSYGPMQPPEIQKDKAIPYLATLIEDYGRRVPRKMLKELWASAYAEGYVQPIKSNRDGEIARIAAKYNVTIEED